MKLHLMFSIPTTWRHIAITTEMVQMMMALKKATKFHINLRERVVGHSVPCIKCLAIIACYTLSRCADLKIT